MQWVKRIFLKTIRWSLLLSIPTAFVLVLIGGKIIELWVGQDTVPSTGLLIGCAIWMVFVSVGSGTAMFLNGLEVVKPQIAIAASASVVNIAMTIWLIPMVGVEGAVFGSVIAYFLCAIIPYYFLLKKHLSIA
jgi:O-antigen/teichoic acid export membrane protein